MREYTAYRAALKGRVPRSAHSPGKRSLLADPRFVLEPYFQRLAAGGFGQNGLCPRTLARVESFFKRVPVTGDWYYMGEHIGSPPRFRWDSLYKMETRRRICRACLLLSQGQALA